MIPFLFTNKLIKNYKYKCKVIFVEFLIEKTLQGENSLEYHLSAENFFIV